MSPDPRPCDEEVLGIADRALAHLGRFYRARGIECRREDWEEMRGEAVIGALEYILDFPGARTGSNGHPPPKDATQAAWRKADTWHSGRRRIRKRERDLLADLQRTATSPVRHQRREDQAYAVPVIVRMRAGTWTEEDREQVRAALGGLPAPQRDLIRWRYFDGLSLSEIALRLNLGERRTQQLLAEALEALAEAIGEA